MKEKNVSQLKIGVVISYLSIGVSILGGLLYTPWIIMRIGQSDYGVYTLANSLISLFLLDFGLSSATSRFVAKYRAQGDEVGLQDFLGAVYRLYLLLDALIFVVLFTMFFFIDSIYINLNPAEIARFKVVYCIAASCSLLSFPCITFNGILMAHEQFIPLKCVDMLQRLCVIGFTVAALLSGMGLYALVSINALCGLCSIAVKYRYVRKIVRVRLVQRVRNRGIYREIMGFSVWSTVWSLAQRLIFNITPTILGIVASGAAFSIAVFGVVTTVEGYFYTITTAINGMFLARITRIILDDSDGKRLTALMIRVGRFQLILNGLIVVGFALIGQDFVILWLGENYRETYLCILLVIIPGLFYNVLQIANTAMIAQNLIKYQAYVHIAMGTCNVILSVFLSARWGVIGASVSIFIAYSLRTILTFVLIKRRLRVNFGDFVKQCYLRLLTPISLACGVGYLFVRNIHANTWPLLFAEGIIVFAVYAVTLFALGLTADEKKYVLTKLKMSG